MPGRTPEGQRSRAVGRSRNARMRPSPTLAKYSATISLVTSGVRSVAGKITRPGLETRTARSPATTSAAGADLAMATNLGPLSVLDVTDLSPTSLGPPQVADYRCRHGICSREVRRRVA